MLFRHTDDYSRLACPAACWDQMMAWFTYRRLHPPAAALIISVALPSLQVHQHLVLAHAKTDRQLANESTVLTPGTEG